MRMLWSRHHSVTHALTFKSSPRSPLPYHHDYHPIIEQTYQHTVSHLHSHHCRRKYPSSTPTEHIALGLHRSRLLENWNKMNGEIKLNNGAWNWIRCETVYHREWAIQIWKSACYVSKENTYSDPLGPLSRTVIRFKQYAPQGSRPFFRGLPCNHKILSSKKLNILIFAELQKIKYFVKATHSHFPPRTTQTQ